MNFEDRITFNDLLGSHAVQGWIIPGRNQLHVQIEKEVCISEIDDLVVLRDKLTNIITKFAEVTGSSFK